MNKAADKKKRHQMQCKTLQCDYVHSPTLEVDDCHKLTGGEAAVANGVERVV